MGLGLGLVLVFAAAAGSVLSPDPGLLLVHTETLLDSLLDLFESGARSDLTIRVQTPDLDQVEIFSVHTLILAIHSPVLSHMVRTRKSSELELSESHETARVFRGFIRYLYSGEVSVAIGDVVPLHSLACKYNVTSLRRGLQEHMTHSLASDWPVGLMTSWLEYAVQMGEAWLRDRCLEALALNLHQLLVSGRFQTLSTDLVLALLPRSDLVLDSELDLFTAVQTWIQTNEPDGLTAENALRSVRYAMIPPQDLFRLQTQSPVLSRYQDSVRDLLFLSFQFHSGSALTMSRFLDLNCSLFLPRVYLSPDWGRAWTLLGPIREDRSTTIQTLLGPSGSDRTKKVQWNLVLSTGRQIGTETEAWSEIGTRPKTRTEVSTGPGPANHVTLSPDFDRLQPRVTVHPVTAGPDLAGIQFQKSLLVVNSRNCRLCSFHHSSSESSDCLTVQDLGQDQLRVHVVLRPVYHRLG